jgi:serine protease
MRSARLAPLVVLTCLLAPAAAPAAGPLGGLEEGSGYVPDEVLVLRAGEERERVVELAPGETVGAVVRKLRRDPGVRWAGPNAIARVASLPRDPGRAAIPGGWQQDQWNFLTPPPRGKACTASAPCGVNAPGAWELLRASGNPHGRKANGNRGPVVAVVDTGVAYRKWGSRFKRNPDFAAGAFVRGRDVLARHNRPLDRNGHGTHVAATIIQRTGNDRGAAGLADGLRVMPVRVLNHRGEGSARDVARGIRWATRNGARVINLSLQFSGGVTRCAQIRGVCRAIGRARKQGIVVVAAAGNKRADTAGMPARASFGVAASTVRGCLSKSSRRGPGTKITAPGGGADAPDAGSHCQPGAGGPRIVQFALKPGPGFRRFGFRGM